MNIVFIIWLIVVKGCFWEISVGEMFIFILVGVLWRLVINLMVKFIFWVILIFFEWILEIFL